MKIFSVLKKDLLLLLRDRAGLIVLFLMPLAFIIPISIALGAGDGYGLNRNNQMIVLPVVDYDKGPRAQSLQVAVGESLKLEKEYGADLIQSTQMQNELDCAQDDPETPVNNPACVEKVGRALLERGSRTAVLIIPQGFSASIDKGTPVSVSLIYSPVGDSIQLKQVEGVVHGATIKISLEKQVSGGLSQLSDLAALAPDTVRQSVEAQAATPQPKNQNPAISLKKITPTNYTLNVTPDTYQQTIPGYTVMYVFFIIATMSASIAQEQSTGTFRRLLSAPVSRAELLGGKLLTAMLVGLAQVFILFGVGAAAFKLDLGGDPLAFFLLTIALVAAATAIGLAAATTQLKRGGLTAPLVIAALLGGCLFPLDLMPPFLRGLSLLVPHSWAMNGYLNLMVRGQGLQQIFPQIAALVGFAALFFLIALRRFDFEKDQEPGP